MLHKIKICKQFADAIQSGDKNFEIRKNDRGYNKGDSVIFTVIDNDGCAIHHEIDLYVYNITYVLNGYGLKNGYVVFGIQKEEL